MYSHSDSFEFHLRSKLKDATSDFGQTRVKPPDHTLNDIIPICARIGVTRTSDITFLDRLYIPNYSAVLPGTEDQIWVYNGKGITKSYAKASALMESVERFSSLFSAYSGPLCRGSYGEAVSSGQKVIHPYEVVESIENSYNEESSVMEYLPAFDLLCNEKILVPAELALYGYNPNPPLTRVFSHFHTNGLASGNVIEEAVSHALCEVIERDAVSIADLCASSIPYSVLDHIREFVVNEDMTEFDAIRSHLESRFVDDPTIYPDVDISEIATEFQPIGELVNKFAGANIPLLIKDITQWDIGIPTFMASSIEWVAHDYGYLAKGYGTHPDARIALIRAITEVSQTRAANIHGARDDLKKIRYETNDEIYKRKWQFMSAIDSCTDPFTDNNRRQVVKFSEVPSFTKEDILDDIDLILSCLKDAGLKRALIVDLTNPNIKIPVVRAIVPGLETFEITKAVMGPRAKANFKRLYY
jgi:thioglycine synthase